ncbi:centrosomal protein of 76 kDa-like [Ciona intestinalis]
MALPAEKVVELKQIIHNQMNQANIHDQIKDIISQSLNRQDPGPSDDNFDITEGQILSDLKRRGVVEDILSKLQVSSPMYSDHYKPATHEPSADEYVRSKVTSKAAVNPTRRYIYFHVLAGKAFLEHVNATGGAGCSMFKLHLHFRGQRFSSNPVPVACEPDLNEAFLLELHSPDAGESSAMMNIENMLSICDPVHLVLTKHDNDGTSSLISSHSFEWREILTEKCGQVRKTIEMMGVGAECKVPAGIIDVNVEFVPPVKTILLPDILDAQLQLERQRAAERDRLFVVYAKQWWKEYLEIRSEHETRPVKIFSQDETGVNRLVCSYVSPLQAGRLITSPKMAARFVSAIPCESNSFGGAGTNASNWQTTHAFLCAKKGSSEDHSNLLCSLLLGFGLEAYVCSGKKSNKALCTWVMTIHCDGKVYFWDSTTGQRYTHQRVDPNDPPATKQPTNKHPFKSIGCVYNNEHFYANIQPLNIVDTTKFNLRNTALWKSMPTDAIASVSGNLYPSICSPLPNLKPPSLDPALMSNTLEVSLKAQVLMHRKHLDLSTEWDDHLSYILTSSLGSYEIEQQTGILNAGNDDFQDAVRRSVPEGHTFKGFPVQFLHRDPSRIISSCLKNTICSEIIECRGDRVRLAVRVLVSLFPDDVSATWVMFACTYKSVL